MKGKKKLVDVTGIEPATPCLQSVNKGDWHGVWRSATKRDWANVSAGFRALGQRARLLPSNADSYQGAPKRRDRVVRIGAVAGRGQASGAAGFFIFFSLIQDRGRNCPQSAHKIRHSSWAARSRVVSLETIHKRSRLSACDGHFHFLFFLWCTLLRAIHESRVLRGGAPWPVPRARFL